VLVAAGVPDDDKGLVDAVLDDDELPPQPVSTTRAASAAMMATKSGRTSVARPTELRMLPPNGVLTYKEEIIG
jgi:hypothetical protein